MPRSARPTSKPASDRGPALPAATWLSGTQVSRLPYGTAVTYEDPSHRGRRVRGRLSSVIRDHLTVVTATGEERTVAIASITRARVIAALLEDGDPVVRKGVPAAEWRGGVIRTGTNPATGRTGVLVEATDGIAWHDEDDLELVDDTPAPARRRGRPRAAADAALTERVIRAAAGLR